MSLFKFFKSAISLNRKLSKKRKARKRAKEQAAKKADRLAKEKAKKEDPNYKPPKRKRRVPMSSEEAKVLSKKLDDISVKVGNVGVAVESVHSNTVPHIGWFVSVIAAFMIIYPGQKIILDTAPDHKVSSWLSGWIIEAKEFTKRSAMNIGIESTGGSVTYSKPLDGKLVVTSHYNPRRKHPVTGLITKHKGTDYRCKVGDNVYAMRAGIVKFSDDKGSAGNMVVLRHSNGEKSVYMHLNSINTRLLEKVHTGEKIGTCGATGRVTGAHLHVEIRKADNTTVDPIKYIGITENAEMWDYFKNTVAQSESSGKYHISSKSKSFHGKYQIGRDAMKSTGYGKISWDTFLNDPKLQDEVYKAWQAQNLTAGRYGLHFTTKAGVKLDINGFITDGTPAWKVAGFLHAAQFGATNALRWYVEGKEFADGNGMLISEYARRGEDAFKSKYGLFASAMPLLRAIEDHK